MKVKSADIPGAFRLQQIRDAVRTVAEGARSSSQVREAMRVAPRHVSFALSAARVLGWLRGDARSWTVTGPGRQLLRTQTGSADEVQAFGDAIRGSAAVRKIAPRLLEEDAPSFGKLAWRIARLSGMAEASARRGARVLLSWRRQALGFELAEKGSESSQSVMRLTSFGLQGYGPFRHARAALQPFTVLIGPSGAGKSSALDVLFFVAEADHHGVACALHGRCSRFHELLWAGQSESLALDFEVALPPDARPEPTLDLARYELELVPVGKGRAAIAWEGVFLAPSVELVEVVSHRGRALPASWRAVIVRGADRVTRFTSERDMWSCDFPLSLDRLALSCVPEDESRFPAVLRLRDLLRRGIARVVLQAESLGAACSPLAGEGALIDGRSLPLLVRQLVEHEPEAAARLDLALRRAVPEVQAVRVREREPDRYLYLELVARDGRAVPAWRASPAVLRALALLTLSFTRSRDTIVFLDDLGDGLDPLALGVVVERLLELEGSQVLAASTAPGVAATVPLENVLCLARDGGETTFIPGVHHKALREWRRRMDQAALLACPFTSDS